MPPIVRLTVEECNAHPWTHCNDFNHSGNRIFHKFDQILPSRQSVSMGGKRIDSFLISVNFSTWEDRRFGLHT